jgi:hypothetical protein
MNSALSARIDWLLALLLCLLGPLPVAAQEPPDASSDARVQFIYTGHTGGVSGGRVDFAELAPAFQYIDNPDIKPGNLAQDNIFRDKQRFIYTDQGPLTLEDFTEFFQQGPPRISAPETIPVLSSDYAHIVEMAEGRSDADWGIDWLDSSLKRLGGFEDARRATARRYRLSNGIGTELFMLDLAAAPPGSADPSPLLPPSDWEMIPSAALKVHSLLAGASNRTLMVIGRPLGDGLRRLHLQKSLRNQDASSTLSIDLGNLVETGVSEAIQQRRDFTLAQLNELQLDAVVPGEAELALPPDEFTRLAAAAPILAANLIPVDPNQARPAGIMLRRIDQVQVAVVGLVDDRRPVATGLSGPQSRWRIEEPVEAARQTLKKLAELHPKEVPACIVLATNIRDERLQTLRHLNGITVVLADMVGTPGEILQESASVGGRARARVRSSLMLARSSPARVGRLTARFQLSPGEAPRLLGLHNEARLITDRLPYNQAARSTLNAIKARYQKRRRELLLPDIRDLKLTRPGRQGDSPPRGIYYLDTDTWNQFIGHIVWQSTGAEATFLRRLPLSSRAIGPINRANVEGWLEVADRVVDVALPGKTLKALAALNDTALTWTGYDPKTGTILGSAVRDEELYRVTTTDITSHLPAIRPLLEAVPRHERWQGLSPIAQRPVETGQTLALREHLLANLAALKSKHQGTFSAAYLAELRSWFAPGVWDGPARWSVRLEDGELSSQALQSGASPAFAQVRNTRVTAPSSQALGGRGRLALLFESPHWALENQVRSVYKRQTLVRDGQDVSQETDDEINLRSEIRLKRLGIPFPAAPLVPFGSYNYTTEFVPDEIDGTTKPRRAELAAITGLMFAPGGMFREWRIGTALRNDLANPGLLEPGLYLSGGLERSLAPLSQAKLRTNVEVYRYFPTDFDTPDRLGLLGSFNSGLAIPLWERFTLNLSADWFVFSGKVPANEQIRSSLEFRVGLGYSLAWKPLHGIWF